MPIGRSDAANVGIVAFGVSRSEDKNGKLQAFARLNNCGPAAADVLLKLFVNDQVRATDADRLSIPPGETRGLAFDLPEFDSGVLHLKAETGDQLAVDDEAWTVVNPPHRARVLLITLGNKRLEQALTTKVASEVAEVRVEDADFLKSQDLSGPGRTGRVGPGGLRSGPARQNAADEHVFHRLPPARGWLESKARSHPAADHRRRRLAPPDAMGRHQRDPEGDYGHAAGRARGGTVLIDSDAGPLLAIAPREGFEDMVLGMVLLEQRAAADGSRAIYRNTDWPWRASFASFIFNLLTRSGRRAGPDGLRFLSARDARDPGGPRFPHRAGRPGAVRGHRTLSAQFLGQADLHGHG